jgi:ferredoxin-NADP reductase
VSSATRGTDIGGLGRRAIPWRVGRLASRRRETPSAHTFVIDVPGWPGHRAGQHVDVRLTAEDGYQAQRSYSIATPADGERIELTVEVLPDGEVSGYLGEELREGDEIELRGPIGGWFAWGPEDGGPLLLVAGGSGVVPLAAMVRDRARARSDVPAQLVLSARTEADVFYRAELEALAKEDATLDLVLTLTRERNPAWAGRKGRVDRMLLDDVAFPAAERPHAFVCGPTGFVEAVADALVDLGHAPELVRTERFGPSGA